MREQQASVQMNKQNDHKTAWDSGEMILSAPNELEANVPSVWKHFC